MDLGGFLLRFSFQAFTSDAAGWSPLCYASMKGDAAVISALLEVKCDPNEKTKKPRSLDFPVGFLCWYIMIVITQLEYSYNMYIYIYTYIYPQMFGRTSTMILRWNGMCWDII